MRYPIYYRSKQIEVIHMKDKETNYPLHNHVSIYTVGLVLKGQVSLTQGNHCHTLSANRFFVVPPYQMHALSLPASYEMLSVCVKKNMVKTYTPLQLQGFLSSIFSTLSISVEPMLLRNAVHALYICSAPLPANHAVLTAALLLQHQPETTVSVHTLANHAHYSPYHYNKLFKKHIGMPPHKFQTQNKIRKAQHLLEHGVQPADIAIQLGFFDQSHFIKSFKTIVGLTPSAYCGAVKPLNKFPFNP